MRRGGEGVAGMAEALPGTPHRDTVTRRFDLSCGNSQIPSDFVVKWQAIDITDVISH